MNKEQFIISRFKKILRESLQEKADSLMTKLIFCVWIFLYLPQILITTEGLYLRCKKKKIWIK